jgi:hypothetical protein
VPAEDLRDPEAISAQYQQIYATGARTPNQAIAKVRPLAEATALRSQSAISSDGHGGRRYAPYVFTE